MGEQPTGHRRQPGLSRLAAICICAMLVLAACDPGVVDPRENDSAGNARPNIVIFYVDDLGYGDVGSYGAVGVETPSIDRLAASGIRFTDAHSSAATCTPSRYSLLLGEHGFRVEADILEGDAPLLKDRKFYRVVKAPGMEHGRCVLSPGPEGQAGSRAEAVLA